MRETSRHYRPGCYCVKDANSWRHANYWIQKCFKQPHAVSFQTKPFRYDTINCGPSTYCVEIEVCYTNSTGKNKRIISISISNNSFPILFYLLNYLLNRGDWYEFHRTCIEASTLQDIGIRPPQEKRYCESNLDLSEASGTPRVSIKINLSWSLKPTAVLKHFFHLSCQNSTVRGCVCAGIMCNFARTIDVCDDSTTIVPTSYSIALCFLASMFLLVNFWLKRLSS